MTLTFEQLMQRHPWREIRGCPGRYILPGRLAQNRKAKDLAEATEPAGRVEVAGATDPAELVQLPGGGGLLSYLKPDGTRVHTLNTAEGLQRKLGE